MSKFLVLFFSILSFAQAKEIENILNLIENHQFRKASKAIHKHKDDLKTENSFGEMIDRTDDLKELVITIREKARSCSKDLKEAEVDELPQGTDYILEEYKKTCTINGELGDTVKKARKDFQYKSFYEDKLNIENKRFLKISSRWERLIEAQNKKYAKDQAIATKRTNEKIALIKKYKSLNCRTLDSFTVIGSGPDGYMVKLLDQRVKDKCLKKAPRRNAPCSRWRYKDLYVNAVYSPLKKNLKQGDSRFSVPVVVVKPSVFVEANKCTNLFNKIKDK